MYVDGQGRSGRLQMTAGQVSNFKGGDGLLADTRIVGL